MGMAMCRKGTVALLLTTGLISVAGYGVGARPAYAQAAAQVYDFNIPAKPIRAAMNDIVLVTGIDVVFAETPAASRIGQPVRGSLTRAQAVAALLAGTDLSYRFTDSNTVTIAEIRTADGAVDVDGAIQLETVTLQGERADGPVLGYRATRTGTATWTDTAIRDVPQSIQVVSRQVLQDREATSLGDSLETVSNVTQLSANAGRAETFSIRGFDVRNYKVDGMTLNQSLITDETNWDTSNVERVEVLKGPSSVLYGDTYYGGSINVVTRKPEFTPGADVEVTVGSDGLYRGQFSVTGPLGSGKTLAYRLSGSAQTSDGFRDVFGSSTRKAITPAIRFEPSDDFRAWASLTYTEQDAPVDSGLIAVDGGVPMDPRTYYGEEWAKQEGHKTILSFGAEKDVYDWLTLRLRGNVNEGKAHRIRAQAVGLTDDGLELRRRAADQYDTSDSQNYILDAIVDFDTGSVSHKLMTGVEYQDGNRQVDLYRGTLDNIAVHDPVHGALPGALALQSISKGNVTTRSFFLQDQMGITERLKLTAGLRYDDISQTSYSGTTTLTRSDLKESSLTPRLGLVYQPTDTLSLYASYSEAFTAQNGADRNGRAFDPEKAKQYEVGAKFDIIPDQLSGTLSAFRIVRQGVLTTDPADSDYSIQTGEQRSQGVELDVSGEIMPGWNISANAAYLNAKVTSDEDIPVGNRLANVPAWSGSIWSTYEIQDGQWQGLGFGGGLFAMSGRAGDLDNSFTMPGYGRVDVTAWYRFDNGVKASLTVRNLFDKGYLRSAQNDLEIYPGSPRTVMFRLSKSF